MRLGDKEAATKLGIPQDRFGSTEGVVDYDRLRIGGAEYRVSVQTMAQAMSAAAANPSLGWVVERVERIGADGWLHPAFFLYTGTPPPLEFAGAEALDQLRSSAVARRPDGVNLTLVGTGTPADFDAARLNIRLSGLANKAGLDPGGRDTITLHDLHSLLGLHSLRELVGLHDAKPDKRLSLEDVTLEQRGGLWVAIQRIGDAIVRVIARTHEQAVAALAAVRMSLIDQLQAKNLAQLNFDSWRIDHSAFTALSVAEKFAILRDSTTNASAQFGQRGRGLDETAGGIETEDGVSQIGCEIEIGNQHSSQRFASAPLSLTSRTAALATVNDRR